MPALRGRDAAADAAMPDLKDVALGGGGDERDIPVPRAHTAFFTFLCLFCTQTQILWTSRQGMTVSGEKPSLDILASDINQ